MRLADLDTTGISSQPDTTSALRSPGKAMMEHFKACFEEERRALLREIQSLQNQLENARVARARDDTNARLCASRKKEKALRSQVSSLQAELSESKRLGRSVQEKLENRAQLVQRLTAKLAALEEAKLHCEQSIGAEKAHVEQQLAFAQDQVVELETRYKARFEEDECRVTLLRNELHTAQEETNSMSRRCRKAELVQQDLRSKLITTTKRFEGLTAKLDKLRKTAAKAEEERDLARAEAEQLNARITRLGANSQGSHMLEKRLNETLELSKSLEKEKKALTEDLEAQRAKFGALARSKARMDQQLVEARSKARQLQTSADDLQVKLSVTTSELETCKRRLSVALEENLTLESENAQLVARIQDSEQSCEQSTKSRVCLDGQVATLEAKCAESERKLLKALGEKETYHKAFLKAQHGEAQAKTLAKDTQKHLATLQIQMDQLKDKAATFTQVTTQKDSAIQVLGTAKEALQTQLKHVDHTLLMAEEDLLSTKLRYLRADELFTLQRIESQGMKDKLAQVSRENKPIKERAGEPASAASAARREGARASSAGE